MPVGQNLTQQFFSANVAQSGQSCEDLVVTATKSCQIGGVADNAWLVNGQGQTVYSACSDALGAKKYRLQNVANTQTLSDEAVCNALSTTASRSCSLNGSQVNCTETVLDSSYAFDSCQVDDLHIYARQDHVANDVHITHGEPSKNASLFVEGADNNTELCLLDYVLIGQAHKSANQLNTHCNSAWVSLSQLSATFPDFNISVHQINTENSQGRYRIDFDMANQATQPSAIILAKNPISQEVSNKVKFYYNGAVTAITVSNQTFNSLFQQGYFLWDSTSEYQQPSPINRKGVAGPVQKRYLNTNLSQVKVNTYNNSGRLTIPIRFRELSHIYFEVHNVSKTSSLVNSVHIATDIEVCALIQSNNQLSNCTWTPSGLGASDMKFHRDSASGVVPIFLDLHPWDSNTSGFRYQNDGLSSSVVVKYYQRFIVRNIHNHSLQVDIDVIGY